jgi:hypothetical protein
MIHPNFPFKTNVLISGKGITMSDVGYPVYALRFSCCKKLFKLFDFPIF